MLQWIFWLLFSPVLNTYLFGWSDFVLQLILWLLFSSVPNTYSYCSIYLVLKRILLLFVSSYLNTYCYCSTYLLFQWIVWLLFSSFLNIHSYCSCTEIHVWRPNCCYYKLTKCNHIWNRISIIIFRLSTFLPSRSLLKLMKSDYIYLLSFEF